MTLYLLYDSCKMYRGDNFMVNVHLQNSLQFLSGRPDFFYYL